MTTLTGPPLESLFASIPHALQHFAHLTPTAIALTSPAGELNYVDLAARVDTVGAQLAGSGVQAGDRVVIAGHNTVEWVLTYLGALRLGAIAAPANNRLNPTQFADQAALLDAVIVLTDSDQQSLAVHCPPERIMTLNPAAAAPGGVLPDLDVAVQPSAAALISFTSGTTSAPKGAVLTHQALVAASTVFAQVIGTDQQSSTLIMVPLFHNTGFVDQLGHMLVVGGRTDLLFKFSRAAATAAAAARPATFVTAVPSVLRLLMIADGADHCFGPATDVLYGGSPMPHAWTQELLDRWPHLRLHHGYGLTEFGSACSVLPPDKALTAGESIGLPAPGVTVRIVDDTGNDGPDGEAGEVWVSGPTRMTEYWSRPDMTADKIRGTWLRTGDIGRITDGLLYLDGRVDDVINRGGEKVLPGYVESQIAALPGVAEVSVFGAPHPILQNRIVAALELRPGAVFDQDAARAALSTRLPDYALPEEFLITDTLPRTGSGKVDRAAISREYRTSTPATNASIKENA